MYFTRNLIPKTLLARFMLIIIVPTIIGQLLAVFLFYDRHWYNVSYYTSTVITNEIRLLLDRVENKDHKAQGLIEDYLNLSYHFYPKAELPSKQPRIGEELEIFRNILNAKIKKRNIVMLGSEGKIEAYFQLENGVLKVAFPVKLLINPTTYIFILWVIFLTLLLLTVSLIFSKNQIKSILELAKAADSFGKGGTPLTYKPTGAKEIRRAGLAFLKMKERIERQITKRTQMLAMISHDLRTPLTRMKLQLELMPASAEKEDLNKDIESMNQMIASYLDFAKGEGGEEFEIVSINDWLREFIETNFKGAGIELELKQDSKIRLKKFAFQRALTNLITNAIKYASKIKISVYASGSNCILILEDNGSGIRDEEKKLVFKPFYRLDKARSLENSGNVGLGLAITKEIITSHHGSIILEDSKELGGLLVKITLPMAGREV